MSDTSQSRARVADGRCGELRHVLGTPLLVTSYERFLADSLRLARGAHPVAVDFANTQVVAMRRGEPRFRELTSHLDFYLPDGMPLVWCLNRQGANLSDRVYGPEFTRRCLSVSAPGVTHYLLGGTEECGAKLRSVIHEWNSACEIVGSFHGRCDAEGRLDPASEEALLAELNRLEPDYIWVGLGTPKQQLWMHRYRDWLKRGLLLGVGFAFDLHAGLKLDAPMWMPRRGLTWIFRMWSEPRRLDPRYLATCVSTAFSSGISLATASEAGPLRRPRNEVRHQRPALDKSGLERPRRHNSRSCHRTDPGQ